MRPAPVLHAGLVVTALSLALAGCGFDGVGSLPLPFAAGDSGGYTVTVSMPDAGTLAPNSEVKVNDVTVGTVRKITFDNWSALVTAQLEPDVRLPATTRAAIGQKSLLGAQYLELNAPPGGPPAPPLTDQAHIPTSQTDRYPRTEDLLSEVSLLLNGGGLGQIDTITTELNRALAGREPTLRQAPQRLAALATALERQRGAMTNAIDSLDRLATGLAAGNATLERATQALPPGLRVLADERPALTHALGQLADMSDTAHHLVGDSHENLVDTLGALQPVLRELVASGDALPQSLNFLTVPFPLDKATTVVRGDYLNVFLKVDLTRRSLTRNFLTGSYAEPLAVLLGGGR